MTRNRWIIVGVITTVAIIAAGLWWMQSSGENTAVAQETAANGSEIVTVTRGNLSASATATGQLEAQQTADLSFTTPGVVTAVLVAVGDEVEAGDPLVQLDTDDLDRNVANAEQALRIQQANYDKLVKGASDLDIAVAEAAVASAEQALADILAGADSTAVAAQETRLRTAQASVQSAYARLQQARNGGGATQAEILEAQKALDEAVVAQREAEEAHVRTFDCEDINGETVCEGGSKDEQEARIPAQQANAELAAAQQRYDQLVNGDPEIISQLEANLAAASAERDAAQARLDEVLAGPTETQVAQAEASLAQAQLTLDNLLRGATDEQLQQAEAQLRQAEITLQQAQEQLEEATLSAPFAGVVTAVDVSVGEQASGPVVSLVDFDSLEVVLSVDELDIGSLSEGQAATLTFESFPDTAVGGEVTSIAPSSTSNNSGIVAYEVHLALGEYELPLRAGMTANANLITAVRDDILLVPNRAVTADRANGTYTVKRLDANAEEGFEEVEIEIGLRDTQFTQVLSGLAEGDQLLIGDTIPRFGGPGSGGPGGGGPGGGGPGGGGPGN